MSRKSPRRELCSPWAYPCPRTESRRSWPAVINRRAAHSMCMSMAQRKDQVRVISRSIAAISTIQEVVHDPKQADPVAIDATVWLSSATVAFSRASKPVLCAVVRLVVQPLAMDAVGTTVTSVVLLGECLSSMAGTEYVEQVGAWIAPQMVSQGAGGITAPTPPVPTVLTPCWAPCSDMATLAFALCGALVLSCITAVISAKLISAAGLCIAGCMLLGPLAAKCVKACVALVGGALAVGIAGCLKSLELCSASVAMTTFVCVMRHCIF